MNYAFGLSHEANKMSWNSNWYSYSANHDERSWDRPWNSHRDYPSWTGANSYSGGKGKSKGKGKGKGAKGKGGKGKDGKGYGKNTPSSGGPYICMKCGDPSNFTKECQAPYNRVYYNYMREVTDEARLALERESSELLVQERLFGKTSVAKKYSVYKGPFDPKESVLTTGWDTATTPANLAKFAETRFRGFRGVVPFMCTNSVFIFTTVLFVFKSKKHAETYANAVNEHAASKAWTTGEPALAWIPKKPTVDAFHAGVDATTDASIQDWAKAQHKASSSSSDESTRSGEVYDKNSKRKKSTKVNNKTTAKITGIDDEDTNSDDSCEKPQGMKRKHNNAVDTEESDFDEAGNKIGRSPVKKLKGNETQAKREQRQVRIAMDVNEDIDEDVEDKSSDASSDVQIAEPKPPRLKMNATDKFINDTMSTTLVKVNKQFADHTQHIVGLEGQVKENMKITKQIGERLDTHIADIPRQHRNLADDILNRLRPNKAGTGNEETASTLPVHRPREHQADQGLHGPLSWRTDERRK